MSVEGVLNWCEQTWRRVPHPGYCTGGARFGPSCYDCSGFTYCAYRYGGGLIIPADSSLVARWGRENRLVFPLTAARAGDLVVHDSYGDPYNSTGPRGHIGIVSHPAGGGTVATWESAGGGKGAGIFARGPGFWAIAVRHPVFAGLTAPQPVPLPMEDELYFLIKGDQRDESFLTQGFVTKRTVYDAGEETAIRNAGILKDTKKIVWPQVYVDRIPTVKP